MSNKSVLIVDDEKNIRLTLSAALETMDLQVDTAVNGEDAMGKIEEKEYDLVLLDIKMPGIDGMKVLSVIRVHNSKTKVIMITAHGTIENAVEAMKLGAVDFIQKPFAPKEIRDLVSKVLDREKLEKETIGDYDSMIEYAKKCVTEGNTLEAAKYVRKAIGESPDRPEAFNFLGVLTEINHDVLEAQKFYRASLALDPTYEPARKNLERTVQWKISKETITLE